MKLKIALPPPAASVCSGCEMQPLVKTNGALIWPDDISNVAIGWLTLFVEVCSGAALVLASSAKEGIANAPARRTRRNTFMTQFLRGCRKMRKQIKRPQARRSSAQLKFPDGVCSFACYDSSHDPRQKNGNLRSRQRCVEHKREGCHFQFDGKA